VARRSTQFRAVRLRFSIWSVYWRRGTDALEHAAGMSGRNELGSSFRVLTSGARRLGLAGVKSADHSFVRHQAVTPFEQPPNQFPINRVIYPHTRPKPAPVRRGEEMLSPKGQIHLGRGQSQCNRRTPCNYLERAERFLPGAEIRMIPRRCFSCLRKGQAQAPRTREDRALELICHSRPAQHHLLSF
jgi:hypothetical protein